MKLDNNIPQIEKSSVFDEKLFSIGDYGLVFDILRSKLYSNPILAICREICTNARDAHREVGTPDVPIIVMLPNMLDHNYRVKDLGPGISPDRMNNIFIKFGSSTKREDNIQHGGFGIGCKTPMAYSDSFAIVTIFNGIKYNYNCYIDETKIGKLALLSQSNTDEPSGTEIIIPVEGKDAMTFVQWTELACRHWTVKPIIKGAKISWQAPEPIISGHGWSISKSIDHYTRQIRLVIDGIEYPLAIDTLRTYADTKLIDACIGDVIMYFGGGELTLSASREQVYLDKKTQNKIRDRLILLQGDIKDLLSKKIDAFPNFWKANLYYRHELTVAFHNLDFLGKLQWRGIPLHLNWVNVVCPIFTFTRGKYSRKYGNEPDKLSKSKSTSIKFEVNSSLFINDLPIKEPTPRHVKKIFEDDPTLKSVQIICCTDKITEDILNKSAHLDKMEPRRLSEVIKVSGRTYTAPSSRLLVFKFNPVHQHFGQVSYASIDEDSNVKVLCLLQKELSPGIGRVPYYTNNSTISLFSMKNIVGINDKVSFYGIDADIPAERIEEEFQDFEPLNKFIDSQIIDDDKINFVEIKLASDHAYDIDENVLRFLPDFQSVLKNPQSLFLRRANIHKRVKELSNANLGLLSLYESIKGRITEEQIEDYLKDNPDYNIKLINERYKEIYPLLDSINRYHFGDIVGHIAEYINLIDDHKKNLDTN